MKTSFLVYKFHKNGHVYSIVAENRTMARSRIEFEFRMDLTGAKFEEMQKNGTVLLTGIEK